MKKVLLITNAFTLALLLLVALYAKIPQKIYSKLANHSTLGQQNIVSCSYDLKHFDFHYKADSNLPKILMLGNSIIRQGNWSQLLKRQDIINRGISGDNLPCICDRLKYLKDVNAKIWFIEGGINDLPQRAPAFLFERYKEIISFAKSENAIPVINLIFYLSPQAGEKFSLRADYKKINEMISELNFMLIDYAKKNNISTIDLNKIISDENNVLKKEYTTDGVHLSDLAYKVWSIEITKVLEKYKI